MAAFGFGTRLLTYTVIAMLAGCGDNVPPPEVNEEVSVTITDPIELTEVTRIPEQDPAFERVEVTADTLVFHYSRAPSERLDVGHVVVGTGDSPFMRKIVAVDARTSTRVAVATEAADLTEVIRKGEFEVRLFPAASSWTENSDPSLSGHTYALDTELSVFRFLGTDRIGCVPVGSGEPLPVLPILKPSLAPRIKVKIVPQVLPPFGKLESAEFSVQGGVTVGVEFDAKVSAGVQCTIDVVALLRESWGEHWGKFKRLTYVQLGPLPLALTVVVDPIFKIEGTVTAEVEATGKATAGVAFEYGTVYREGEWHQISSFTSDGTTEVVWGEDSGNLTASVKASGGFQIGALLYDTAGPIIGLTGFLEGKLVVDPAACHYTSTINWGADMLIGLLIQLPIVAKEIAKVQDTFNLFTKELARVEGRPWRCRHEQPVAFNATYLRTNNDTPSAPPVVDLTTLGITPGDTIRLSAKGTYKFATDGRPNDEDDRGLGVFSSSSTILGATVAHRVPGAIDAGTDEVTDGSLQDGMSTDIPEDFKIRQPFDIVVPAGASHLVVGVNDSYYADNAASAEGYFIVIEY